MFKRLATSFGVFPIGPGVSYLRLVGMMLAPSMIPIDGFTVYSEALMEGVTRDPSVSVSRAKVLAARYNVPVETSRVICDMRTVQVELLHACVQ